MGEERWEKRERNVVRTEYLRESYFVVQGQSQSIIHPLTGIRELDSFFIVSAEYLRKWWSDSGSVLAGKWDR